MMSSGIGSHVCPILMNSLGGAGRGGFSGSSGSAENGRRISLVLEVALDCASRTPSTPNAPEWESRGTFRLRSRLSHQHIGRPYVLYERSRFGGIKGRQDACKTCVEPRALERGAGRGRIVCRGHSSCARHGSDNGIAASRHASRRAVHLTMTPFVVLTTGRASLQWLVQEDVRPAHMP